MTLVKSGAFRKRRKHWVWNWSLNPLWRRFLKRGITGVLLSVLLLLIVWQISGWAAALLIPYTIWSPIGTYTTWEMIRLNPTEG
jgi:tryptophan-rich sensory protein